MMLLLMLFLYNECIDVSATVKRGKAGGRGNGGGSSAQGPKAARAKKASHLNQPVSLPGDDILEYSSDEVLA